MNKEYVIYHGGCLDGIAAAWCFWKLQDNYNFVPGRYGKEIDIDFNSDHIYLVDFSLSKEKVEELLSKNCTVYLLDHHKDAVETLSKITHSYFFNRSDITKSGAIIAWEYLNTSLPPSILLYIQDRDLWKFEHKYTKEITASAYLHVDDLIEFNKEVINRPIEEHIERGKTLLLKQDNDIQKLIKVSVRYLTIGDYEVPTVNCPYFYASDLGNLLAEEYFNESYFSATYYDTEDSRVFSLRSLSNVDVSHIARLYGGNGHKNAAGFSVPRDHELAKS